MVCPSLAACAQQVGIKPVPEKQTQFAQTGSSPPLRSRILPKANQNPAVKTPTRLTTSQAKLSLNSGRFQSLLLGLVCQLLSVVDYLGLSVGILVDLDGNNSGPVSKRAKTPTRWKKSVLTSRSGPGKALHLSAMRVACSSTSLEASNRPG